MNNKFVLESLSSDLKRVALGMHRGSETMAMRFLQEALKRKSEVNMESIAPYLRKILGNINIHIDKEDALMYSTLIQNYTRTIAF